MMGWEDVLKIDQNRVNQITDVNELKELLREYGYAYNRQEKQMIRTRIRQLGG